MKKALSIFLILILMSTMLIGCSSTETGNTETPSNDTGNNETPSNDTGIAKVGLGHITSIAKSKDLDGDVLPVGQVDTVMAAVAFDKDGKVVKVTIDTAQTKVEFDKDLQVTSDLNAEYKTKVEKGTEYGMAKVSSIQKEWFEQIAELEKWMVGKTVEEIKGMKIKDGKADEAELTSSVTISVQDYIAVVEEAYSNAREVSGAVDLGLGNTISIAKSKGYSVADGKETLPVAQVDTVMAATVFDKDGKVVETIIDTAQTKVEFDKDGKVTSDKTAEYKTKVEKGSEYGMANISSIQKEWFEQIAELEKWMSGKTIEEIKGMKIKDGKADEAELTSSVTISVQGYIDVVEESYNNAK